jgi:hypothetical protein
MYTIALVQFQYKKNAFHHFVYIFLFIRGLPEARQRITSSWLEKVRRFRPVSVR